MNNFLQKNENNPANAYYPEAMSFDGTKFVKMQQTSDRTNQIIQESKPQQNTQTDMGNFSFNGETNPLANLLSGNMSETLMAMLTSKMKSGSFDKNNIVMQALSSMLSPKKTSNESKDENIIDVTQSYEDM